MNEDMGVSRKNAKEDRVAICPKYGCEYMIRVKPLKFRFFGFGKHPKCKNHHLHLVYVDEMIGDFVDAVLACFFDKSAIPPRELIEKIHIKFPYEIESFVRGWVYCITIGRGAPIVSRYMDGISNGYLKQLSRKQKKALKKEANGNPNKINKAIKDGLKEITNQYIRLLKYLRAHSEILNDHQKLEPLSKSLRNFLNEWLKGILKNNNVLNKSEHSCVMSLQEIKLNYDEILNVGICRCLLGLNFESREIRKAKITAFDRFVAYDEFYREGLTKKFTKSDILTLLCRNSFFQNQSDCLEEFNYSNQEESKKKNLEIHMKKRIETCNTHISNLFDKIKNYILVLIDTIDCSIKHLRSIKSKSLEILEKHYKNSNKKQIIIPKDANLKVIAGAIVYAVIQTEKDIPKVINGRGIMENLSIKKGNIYDYYHKHFKNLYPRVKKQDKIDKENQQLKNRKYTKHHFTIIKGFLNLRNNISQYFFECLKDNDFEINRLVRDFAKNILENKNLPSQFSQDELKILRELSEHSDFIRYFSDLAEIVKYIINTSILHKKIGANPTISYISDGLKAKRVTLFQSPKSFPITIAEIYDFLNEKFSNYVPKRSHKNDHSLSQKERNIISYIIGSRIKLYCVKNIYDGLYFNQNKAICSRCFKEGFTINTDLARLEAIEFHHNGDDKNYEYTSRNLFLLFQKSNGDPKFLENLISEMERDQVELLCRNHHNLLHNKNFKNFGYLINWEKIFTLDSIVIHLIIRVCVNSHKDTKNMSVNYKKNVVQLIIGYLRKRYIIEIIYKGICPCCEEFNTKKHLPSFQFAHLKEKKISASQIYNSSLSCLDIVNVLTREVGGYVCGNCHTVIDYNRSRDILKRIYDTPTNLNKVLEDQSYTKQKFKLIQSIAVIGEPLKKKININYRLIEYLFAISEIIKSGQDANTNSIANYLNISTRGVRHVLQNRWDFFCHFLESNQFRKKMLKRYYLTVYGKKVISLMKHFKNYYSKI